MKTSEVDKIYDRDAFASDQSYEAYLLGIKMGNKINEYINKGFIVIDKDAGPIIDRKFKFSFMGPTVGLVSKDNKSCLSYGNASLNNEGKVTLSKSAIVNGLKQFKIINPKDIKNVKF